MWSWRKAITVADHWEPGTLSSFSVKVSFFAKMCWASLNGTAQHSGREGLRRISFAASVPGSEQGSTPARGPCRGTRRPERARVGCPAAPRDAARLHESRRHGGRAGAAFRERGARADPPPAPHDPHVKREMRAGGADGRPCTGVLGEPGGSRPFAVGTRAKSARRGRPTPPVATAQRGQTMAGGSYGRHSAPGYEIGFWGLHTHAAPRHPYIRTVPPSTTIVWPVM
jgi:hypothetical protein